MSLTSQPINEAEQAAEKAGDHLLDRFAAAAAAFLESLSNFELTISLRKKP